MAMREGTFRKEKEEKETKKKCVNKEREKIEQFTILSWKVAEEVLSCHRGEKKSSFRKKTVSETAAK